MSNQSFFKSVEQNFDKAAPHTGLPKGLLDQIKVCNSVYQMHFPVKIGGEVRVFEAYRVQHSHHRLPTKPLDCCDNTPIVSGHDNVR